MFIEIYKNVHWNPWEFVYASPNQFLPVHLRTTRPHSPRRIIQKALRHGLLCSPNGNAVCVGVGSNSVCPTLLSQAGPEVWGADWLPKVRLQLKAAVP